MSQPLAKIYVHLVFSTKNRNRDISDDIARPYTHTWVAFSTVGIAHPLKSTANPTTPTCYFS